MRYIVRGRSRAQAIADDLPLLRAAAGGIADAYARAGGAATA